LKVETKGRRRTKRFRGDMDDLAGYTGMKQLIAVISWRLLKLMHGVTRKEKRRKGAFLALAVEEAPVVNEGEEVLVVAVEEAQVLEVLVVAVEEAQVLEVVVVSVEEAQVLEVVVVSVEEAQVLEVVVVVVEEAQVLELAVEEGKLIMDRHSVICVIQMVD
jgi:hypothetical protein